ncbi:hypothetical protein BDN71DRAFT_1310211 [Pleurotus eryngii]|uniref:Uncharacterized protein n=1 Tax=Pleurotus eryngii TaxID=5323 RepID=A0A9P5ZS99_PLEER|nr:hypothetical protein BDN71DRAFT_1310211 [Pleurotus eryngii]
MTGCIVSLEAPLFRSMVRAAAAALEGTIYMVTDSDVPYTILSVGVCFQPDTRLFSSEAQRALGWNEFFEISQEARDWWVKEVCWSILPESRSLDHHAGSLESIGCSQQFTC